MDQPTYDRLFTENRASDMIRTQFKDPVINSKVTVLICQGKMSNDPHDYSPRSLTQLCLESLLRFYPFIPVFVVNGSPGDYDSSLYLDLMALKYKNVKVWHRDDLNSHGDMMNDAIRNHITTEFVMLLDNDSIIRREGLIEGMMDQMKEGVFATGSTMIVSRKNEACGVSYDETDVLRYAHPSCAIINRAMYLQVRPFCNHGAPCWASMVDAEIKGWKVESFPVVDYECHLSGASWCNPRTIWSYDNDTLTRPFITFIATSPDHLKQLEKQTDHDFDILVPGKKMKCNVIIHDGNPAKAVDNRIYDLRFRVKGHYVCLILENVVSIDENFVKYLRKEIVKESLPEELTYGGLRVVSRRKWQYEDCLYNKF